MKNRIFALIMAVVCLSTVLAGCKKEACETHADDDLNAVCDVCEAELCAAHVDDAADMVCDVCNVTLKACEAHVDEVVDNVCDVCKVTIPVKCDIHKDDDANKICDACGNAIVVKVEQIAPETGERVDMVVNSIPSIPDFSQLISTDKKENIPVTGVSDVELRDVRAMVNEYVLFAQTNEETGAVTYTIYNAKTDKNVFTVTEKTDVINDEIENPGSFVDNIYYDVSVSLTNHYYAVVSSVFDYTFSLKSIAATYYTYAGEKICESAWSAEASTEGYDEWNELFGELVIPLQSVNGVDYIRFDGKIWAFDSESGAILEKGIEPMELIHRPAFDTISEGKYGYIKQNGKIFVYDLKEWIDCVYSYEIPDYSSYDWFVLESGNILVQGLRRLTKDAISYDCIIENAKYDIVYSIVDPATATVTDAEFGYYIDNLFANEIDVISSDVKNVAFVSKIVDDRIVSDTIVMGVDNALNVTADLTDGLENWFSSIVADGLYKKVEALGGDAYATYIVDVNGKTVAYVPYGAEIGENCIFYDGAVYSFKMEKLFQIEGAYDVLYAADDYMILSAPNPDYTEENMMTEPTDLLYYYDLTAKAPVLIEKQKEVGFALLHFEEGYQISYVVETTDENGASGWETVSAFYNIDNVLVEDIDRQVVTIIDYNELYFNMNNSFVETEESLKLVVFADGSIALLH